MTRFIGVSFGVMVAVSALMVGGCSSSKGGASGGDASADGAADGAQEGAADALASESGENGDGESLDGGGDGAAPEAAEDASPDMIAPDAYSIAPYALVRFANWSPDSPAVDMCVAPHGSGTYTGPLVAGVYTAQASVGLGDGGSSGIAFPLVTSYFPLAPGAYDLRFVAAGSSRCDGPILPDSTTPSLAAGTGTLAALMGEVAPAPADSARLGLRVATFKDQYSEPAGAPLNVRFINASPALPLAALSLGSFGMGLLPLFTAVPFGQVDAPVENDATVRGVDEDGYCRVADFVGTVLDLTPAGATVDGLVTQPLYSVTGIPITFVAVGSGPSAANLTLLECLDSAGTAPPLASCRPLP